jgi:hypothetical protein
LIDTNTTAQPKPQHSTAQHKGQEERVRGEDEKQLKAGQATTGHSTHNTQHTQHTQHTAQHTQHSTQHSTAQHSKSTAKAQQKHSTAK